MGHNNDKLFNFPELFIIPEMKVEKTKILSYIHNNVLWYKTTLKL